MFAAIDVGSFALELGIYEISDKTGIRNVEHIRHVIALGSDTFSEGKISYDLVDEMCRVLEKFTETMREAKNSRIILDQIRVRTGLEVHIISNSEQRFISYKAVASKGGEFNQIIQKGTAIVDVGFGSAQISLFDKDSLVATQNLPLGSLRLRSQLAKIPASVDGHRLHIEEIVDNELITFRKMYLRDRQITNLIGIGDNILYLMRRLGIKGGENRVDSAAMHAFYDKLSQMTIDQIEENFGVNSVYKDFRYNRCGNVLDPGDRHM
jgi:exopolyphosphatase/guanosine-5'-triphosphate,3'-diphosphate pyrophosphatase